MTTKHISKKRVIIYVLIAVLIPLTVFIALFGNPIVLKNNYNFGQSVLALEVDSIALNELTSFTWDTVYIFTPYMPRRDMEEIIGFRSRHITPTFCEGAMQLIFVRGNRVVCSIVGYREGFHVFFYTARGENYSKIKYEDNAVFSVERRMVRIVDTYIPMIILLHGE